MKQRRRTSLVEAAVNVAAGLVVAIAGQAIIFPIVLGIEPTWGAATEIAGFMTLISIVRQYVLRRIFEELRVTGILP